MPPNPAQVLSSITAFVGQHEHAILISAFSVLLVMASVGFAVLGTGLRSMSDDEFLEMEKEVQTALYPNVVGVVIVFAFLGGYKRLLDKCFK